MRIGLQVIEFNWDGTPENTGSKLKQIAQTADASGFYSLWVMDHYFQMEVFKPATDPMLEGYTTQGFLAAVTDRVKLGLLVTGAFYRYPGLLAKIVTTLDVLSGGRAYLGIGAGWYEREAHGLGVPFPPLATRFEQLEETLQIIHQMWRGDVSAFNGKHYQLAELISSPQPLSKPHPPIMIGGEGERKTLRFVAQYGDACNMFFGMTNTYKDRLEYLKGKIDVIKRHCDAVKRDFNEIEITVLGTALIDAAQGAGHLVEMCEDLAKIGVHHVIMNVPNSSEIAPLEVIGRDLIPAVASLNARA